MSTGERFWPARLRWRLRGAWQWPAFALATLADGFVLHELPPVQGGIDLVPALIVASFGNLFLVGVVAPWLGRRLVVRARRVRATAGAPGVGRPVGGLATAPTEVVMDRTATALLGAGALGLLAAGLGSQPLIVSETEATEENASAVRAYVGHEAPEEVRRNLETANTVKLADGFFRTCIALDDRRRAWCVFTDTNAEPAQVRRDPNPAPNGELYRDLSG